MNAYSYPLFLPFTKNFTALIPGTTVEILDQDSKNVIQLIVAAYNVSYFQSSCLCVVRKRGDDTEGFEKKGRKRRV